MTNNNFTRAAIKRGQARSNLIQNKVLCALMELEKELASENSGNTTNARRITKNEIIRRAGIGKTTLFSAKQKELNKKVDAKIKELNNVLHKNLQTPKPNNRKTRSETLKAWQDRCKNLQDKIIITELELQHTQHELLELKMEIATLKDERKTLLTIIESNPQNKISRIKT